MCVIRRECVCHPEGVCVSSVGSVCVSSVGSLCFIRRVGQNKIDTCLYSVFGMVITKYAVMYGVYIYTILANSSVMHMFQRHTCLHASMHVCKDLKVHTCVHTYTHTHAHTHTHGHTHTRRHTHTQTNTYAHTHTHTGRHTHTQLLIRYLVTD